MRKATPFAIAAMMIVISLYWRWTLKHEEGLAPSIDHQDHPHQLAIKAQHVITSPSLPQAPSGGLTHKTSLAKSPALHVEIQEPRPHWPQGKLLIEDRTPIDHKGCFNRTLVFETNFVHPLIRVEQSFQLEPGQRKAKVIRSIAMVADHILVKVEPSLRERFESAIAAKGLKTRQRFGAQGLALVEFDGLELNRMNQVMSLLNQGFIGLKSCEKDHLIRALDSPRDPDFIKLWALNNDGSSGGSHDSDIDAVEAWTITKGSRAVTVGVIDTGIDLQHPDLVSNLWINANEIPDNNTDDDGNGYIDDVHGYDFINNDANPDDDNNHGSHCAGTIGASANDVGVVGVAWEVSLAALKFLDAFGFGTTSAALAAIDYANNMAFDITSNSWGSGVYSQLLHDSIKKGGEQGQVFIAAAGNDSSNNDNSSTYPANYQLDHIISVGASDHNDQIAYFSNHGLTSVDLFAPGVDIYSCATGGLYQYFSGTSMAAPHVAGVAALIKAVEPQASPLEIKTTILSHGDPLPQLKDLCVSGGRLNAHRSLMSLTGTYLTIENGPFVPAGPGNDDAWINPGETHNFKITLRNPGINSTGNLNIAFNILPKNPEVCTVDTTVDQLTALAPGQEHHYDQWRLRVSSNIQQSHALTCQVVINDDQGHTWIHTTTFSVHPELLFQGQVVDDQGQGVPSAEVNLSGQTDQNLICDADGFFSTTCIAGDHLAIAHADHTGLNPSEEISFRLPPSIVDHVFILGQASIDIDPTSLTFNLHHGQSSSQVIRLENQGTSPLNYTMNGDFSVTSIHNSTASTLAKVIQTKPEPSPPKKNNLQNEMSQKRILRPQRPANSRSFQGDLIRFSVSEVGTIDRFEYPIGTNHFYPFFPFTGFSLHYRLKDKTISLVNDGFLIGLHPPKSSVLLNDAHKLELSYEFSSTDNTVAVIRRFYFNKHSSSLRIEDRIENRSQAILNDIVFKRFVDTAVDGIPVSEHRGFEHKNILYGKRSNCFGFGTNDKALLRDIDGWNDLHTKETYVDDPDGPASMDAILIYHFEEQHLAPLDAFDIVTTLAAANDVDELEQTLDEHHPWLRLSQQRGTIAPGEHQDLIVEANTNKLSAGRYSAEITLSHNVLNLNELNIPVQLTVTGSPSFHLPVSSLDFGKVIVGEFHTQSLKLKNEGFADLILNINWDSDCFSCSQSNINIAANAEQVLTLSYSPNATQLDRTTIHFNSNDPQQPSGSISLTGHGVGAPVAKLSPVLIEKKLIIGQRDQLSLNLDNLGHSRLDFQLKDIVQKEKDDAFKKHKFSHHEYHRQQHGETSHDQEQAIPDQHPNVRSLKERLAQAHHPQEWIVCFHHQSELKATTLKTCGVLQQRTLSPPLNKKRGSKQLALIRCDQLLDEASTWKKLEADPRVQWAEPNYIYKLLATPNDPHFPLLWGMENSFGGDIDAPQAWDIETGDPKVVVAVLDTGIDEQHEDLKPNLWVNPGEVEGDLIDNDGNGYVDDVHGWNFYDNNASLFDGHGHGSHVSGILAAVGNNGIGIAGVCWKASVATVKIFNAMGFTHSAAIIEAIGYLELMDFRVSNNSWGGGAFSQGIHDAIAACDHHLFIAAAGNDGLNNDHVPFYPSSYNLDQIISVASTSQNDVLSNFSNFGQHSVDLTAPGEAIFSCYPGGDYGYMSGTSMAAPHVTGACALLLSHKKLNRSLLKGTLLQSCDQIPTLGEFVPDGRRLNLKRILTQSPPTLVRLTPSSGNVEAGSDRQLTVELNSSGQSFGDHHHLIQIETNDPQNPVLSANLILHIRGEALINASTHHLDMGSLEVGKYSSRSLTLTNTGSDTLNISELSWRSEHLQISSFPKVIEPQGSKTLNIIYQPIESGAWSDDLIIKSDASNDPILEIGINGFSYQNSYSVDFGNTVLKQYKSILLDITNPKAFPISPIIQADHPMMMGQLSPSVIRPFTSSALKLSFKAHHLGTQQGSFQLVDDHAGFSCNVKWNADCSKGELFSVAPLHIDHKSLSHESLQLKLDLQHLSSANNSISVKLSPELDPLLSVTLPSDTIAGDCSFELVLSNSDVLSYGKLSGNIIITIVEQDFKDSQVVPINIQVLPNPNFDRDQVFWPLETTLQVHEGEAQFIQLSRRGPWLPELTLELTSLYHLNGFEKWVGIADSIFFEADQEKSKPLIVDFFDNAIYHDNVMISMSVSSLDDLTLVPNTNLDIELVENDTLMFTTQYHSLNLTEGSEVNLNGHFNVGPWHPISLNWQHAGSCQVHFHGKTKVDRRNHSQTRRWTIKATTDLSHLDETIYIQWGDRERLDVPIRLIQKQDPDQQVFFSHDSLSCQEGQSNDFYLGLFEPPQRPMSIHFGSPSEAFQIVLPDNSFIPKNGQQVIPFSILAQEDLNAHNENHQLSLHLNDEVSGHIEVNTIDNDKPSLSSDIDHIYLAPNGSMAIDLKVSGQSSGAVELNQHFKPDIGGLRFHESLPLRVQNSDWIHALTLHLERDSQINSVSTSTTVNFNLDRAQALTLPVTLVNPALVAGILAPRFKHIQNIQEGDTQHYPLSIGPASSVLQYSVRIVGGDGLSAQPSTLSFSEAIWPRSLDLTLVSSQDDDAAPETYLLELYHPEDQHFTLIQTQDPDQQGLLIDATKGSLLGNQTWGCNLSLKAKPQHSVHVLVSDHNPNSGIMFREQDLIFTPENWYRKKSLLFEANGDQNSSDQRFVFEISAAGLDSQSIELTLKSSLINLNIESLTLSEEHLYLEDHLRVTITLNQDDFIADQVQLRVLETNSKPELIWNGRQAHATLRMSQIGDFTLMAEIIGQEDTRLVKSFEVTDHPLTPQMDFSGLNSTLATKLTKVGPHLDEEEGSRLLGQLISTATSAEMIVASEAFLSTVSSGETKSFISGQHAITVSHVQFGQSLVHLDKSSFPMSLTGVPEDHVVMISTSAVAIDDSNLKLPHGSVGQLFVFELRKGSEDVEDGFEIELRLQNIAKPGVRYSLYVQSADGSFTPSDAKVETDDQDLIATLNHFSTFTLVEAALSIGPNHQEGSSSETSTPTTNHHHGNTNSFDVQEVIGPPSTVSSAGSKTENSGGGGCLLRDIKNQHIIKAYLSDSDR